MYKSECLFRPYGSSGERHRSGKALYDWIVEQRKFEISVSTINFVSKAISYDSSFKDRDHKKISFVISISRLIEAQHFDG